MKNQIDKFFVVLGAVALAVFNAAIPNIFIKESTDFSTATQNINDLQTYNSVSPKPKYIYQPKDINDFRNNVTSPLLTRDKFLYEKQVYTNISETDKKFAKEICDLMPECEVFINYSIPTVFFSSTSITQTTASLQKVPKCEKPKVEVESKVGKIVINITPGAATYAIVSGFNIYRDDKGEEKPYVTVGVDELKKTDDKVEPDKDYKYKVQQICTATEGGQEVLSEFSDEQTAHAKRKFYVKCFNNGTYSTTANIHVQEYNDDGTMVDGSAYIKVNSDITIPLNKIVTGFTLISINMSHTVRLKNKSYKQPKVKYCKLDPQKPDGRLLEERCEDNSIVEITCEFEEPKQKESEDNEKTDKEKEEKPEEKKVNEK